MALPTHLQPQALWADPDQRPIQKVYGEPGKTVTKSASLSDGDMVSAAYGDSEPHKYIGPSPAAARVVADLPNTHKSLVTAPFPIECTFPDVMLSYQSNSTGISIGKAWMWALANGLRENGITSFNGYMVKAGEDWQQKWFGKLPEAKSVVVMLSKTFFKSEACVAELKQAVSQQKPIIPIFLDDVTTDGHFLGEEEWQVEIANYLKTRLNNNRIPPLDQGVFQGEVGRDFQRNIVELVKRLHEVHSLTPEQARHGAT